MDTISWSLACNSSADLFKLTRLHLEHTDCVNVNSAHFPCFISLHSLCLKRDKVAIVVSSLDWVWNLENMDLLGNKIKYMEPHVFETLPHLQSLQLDSNYLTCVEPWILNSWKSLTSIIRDRNLWNCGCNMCSLASWLRSFQGCYDDKSQCASQEYVQRYAKTS